MFWPDRCISLWIHKDGAEALGLPPAQLEGIFRAAAAQWTGTSCSGQLPSVRFIVAGQVSCNQAEFNPEGPNANVVVFHKNNWPHGFSRFAVTTLTFLTSTGEIVDADLELNLQDHQVTVGETNVAVDLQSVLTHEFGHILGLSHTQVYSATMYEFYGPGDLSFRDLDFDDQEAICTVYPPGRALPPCDPLKGFSDRCGGPVIGGCGMSHGPTGRWWSWPAGLTLAAAAIFRFQRRRSAKARR